MTDLRTCPILALIEAANCERVAYYLADDRLVVRPSRTRPDIVEALIARADEVAAFLATQRRVWRTPPEEEAYRERMADEMTLALFGLPWKACEALVIDALATIVGEAWERHVARLPLLQALPDGFEIDSDEQSIAPVVTLPARPTGRYSMRGGGSRG